jgi:hypothetical protein
MENNVETIGITIIYIVILLFIASAIARFVIGFIKDGKIEKKCDLVLENANKEYKEFIEYFKSQSILKDTKVYYRIESMINKVEKQFTPKFLETPEETLERYSDAYKNLVTVIEKLKDRIERVKTDISYNISHWYKDEEFLPFFFVLEDIDNGYKTYCHSTNLHFVNDSQDVIGHIFDHENNYNYLMTISPREYKILPMTKNEFYNKYLLNRINIMKFTDFRQKNEYEKYLIEEFNKHNKDE